MIRQLWTLSVHTRAFLRRYMPANILLDAIRTRRGLKWGVPAMLLAVPYLLAASTFTTLITDGGPGWLNLLVLLCLWLLRWRQTACRRCLGQAGTVPEGLRPRCSRRARMMGDAGQAGRSRSATMTASAGVPRRKACAKSLADRRVGRAVRRRRRADRARPAGARWCSAGQDGRPTAAAKCAKTRGEA